jgi:hypothetical protein
MRNHPNVVNRDFLEIGGGLLLGINGERTIIGIGTAQRSTKLEIDAISGSWSCNTQRIQADAEYECAIYCHLRNDSPDDRTMTRVNFSILPLVIYCSLQDPCVA